MSEMLKLVAKSEILDRPAYGILPGLFRSRTFDLLLHRLPNLLDIRFQVFHCKLRVFLHALHHGIRQLVNLNRLTHRLPFLQVNFSDRFLKFIWSMFSML